MVKIPDEVFNSINNEKNSKILATVGTNGAPHAIQAGSIAAPSNEIMIVGANPDRVVSWPTEPTR
jgi:hypothetical protein